MASLSVGRIPVDAFQKGILEREVQAFLKGVADPEAQAHYTDLLQQVENEEVGEELAEALEDILEILVESGRARKLYGAAGENSLISLFQKTARGSALAQMSTEVNQALKGMQGQTLKGIHFRSSGPGSWALTLETDQCELTLRIDRKGLKVGSIGIDLA
jgi:hypothetical protein